MKFEVVCVEVSENISYKLQKYYEKSTCKIKSFTKKKKVRMVNSIFKII